MQHSTLWPRVRPRTLRSVSFFSVGTTLALGAGCAGPPKPLSPEPTATPSLAVSTGAAASAPSAVAPASATPPALPPELEKARTRCEAGHGDDCEALAIAYFKGLGVAADGPAAAALLRKACDLGNAEGCYNIGAALFGGELGQTADKPGAVSYFEKACSAGYATGCFNLGVMYLKADGVAQDTAKGKALMVEGCRLGEKDACDIVKELDANAAAATGAGSDASVPGANVTMDALEVDGLRARKVSCRLDGGGGGLLGALAGPTVIIASLAKSKAHLDQCAPAGAEPRVMWSFARGRTTKVEASGVAPNVKSCVEGVVKNAASSGDGTCAATLVIGNKK